MNFEQSIHKLKFDSSDFVFISSVYLFFVLHRVLNEIKPRSFSRYLVYSVHNFSPYKYSHTPATISAQNEDQQNIKKVFQWMN